MMLCCTPARRSLLALAAALVMAAPLAVDAQEARAFPDMGTFASRVREAIRLDYELQSGFSYTEHRRDIRISKLGKVEVGPLRTFEVFPSPVPGRTYKRLVAVNGAPLGADELARRDREHAAHLAKLEARARQESAKERSARLGEEAESLKARNAILDDAFAVYDARFEAREVLDGQPVFALALTPRPDARISTREGRWLKAFEGRVWIAETDHQIARLEMRARDDVSIGWGILGRVHRGSRFAFARRKFQNAWLPAEIVFDATGRTLLFRRFDLQVVTTYSDYKRISG